MHAGCDQLTRFMPGSGPAAADPGGVRNRQPRGDIHAPHHSPSTLVPDPGDIAAPPTDVARGSLLDLATDEIHLWCADFEQIRNPDLEAAYLRLLSPAERARQARFHFDRDRHRFLVTRALVRTVLSRYARVPPRRWQFASNAYGRPRITNDDPGCSGLTFNLSHTDGLVVLGIARGTRLGVDAELPDGRNANLDIARNFFAPVEVSDLQALPPLLQPRRFFELWTLKESYIKARGQGMSVPLDRFGFTFPGTAGIALWIDPGQADPASGWRFLQFRLASGHLVAVCSDIGRRTHTTIRGVVPLRSEQVLDLRPTRTSEAADLPRSGATG